MSDPLSNEFEVVVDGDTFVFRKPTIRYRIELGYQSADVRRRAYPAQGGALPGDFGIDAAAAMFASNCAIMELYLVRSTATWPFAPGEDGKPKVDFDKFPPDCEDSVWKIGKAFEDAIARFRKRGDTDKPSGDGQTVGGQPNPG
jgi:hypothetical protein